MGLYSWFSSAHTHRKDPSTFSQKASPHTPLSSSHSFTSGKGSTGQVRRRPHFWQLFVLTAVPRLVVHICWKQGDPWWAVKPICSFGKGLLEAGLYNLVRMQGSGKREAKDPNSNSGFKKQPRIVLRASYESLTLLLSLSWLSDMMRS